jgi:hypothetical protein
MFQRRHACPLVVAAVALVAAGQAPARPLAGDSRPRLRLADADPPTVHATGFARAERVRLTLSGIPGGTRVRHRRASGSGTFSVTFRHAKAGHCSGFTVRARGDAGSRAMLRRMQLPACSPE